MALAVALADASVVSRDSFAPKDAPLKGKARLTPRPPETLAPLQPHSNADASFRNSLTVDNPAAAAALLRGHCYHLI